MKVLIIHNSLHGNGLQLAKRMAKVFSEHEVRIAHNKEVSPEETVEMLPDLIIMGTAVRAFRVSRASKKWMKNLNKHLQKAEKKIPYGACFITHALSRKRHMKKGEKFRSLLEKGNIDNVWPTWISGKVAEQFGPFEPGMLDEVQKTSEEIVAWAN